MQYFYIVGYTQIGNDLTLCKVSLNEHTFKDAMMIHWIGHPFHLMSKVIKMIKMSNLFIK